MSESKFLFISNLGHSLRRLKEMPDESVLNMTELFGSCNLPMGVLSIQAYIEKVAPNATCDFIDLNSLFLLELRKGDLRSNLKIISSDFTAFLEKHVFRQMEDYRPDVVAISNLFDKSIPTLVLLAEEIKKRMPNCIVLAGGHPCNHLYCELFEMTKAVDGVCLGEGEIPFAQLAQSNSLREELESKPWFVTDRKLQTENRSFSLGPMLSNLDEIPPYSYEKFFQKYTEETMSLHNNVLDLKHSFNRQAAIMTSRGCPYSCIFCASGAVHGKPMRSNSIERMEREIDYWVDEKKADTIGFMDDHFLFDMDRTVELIDYAGSKGVDIRFPNGLAISHVTEAFVDACVRNNIKEIQFALESGSERVLREIIKKPLTLQKAEKVFDWFKDTDIFIKVFLVTGFADETYEDIQDGLNFLRKANFHWASISAPTPISGSRLLREMRENGHITHFDYDAASFFGTNYANPEVAERMNGDIRYTINLDINFVHNPYMRMGKYEKAKARFQSILASYPEHAFAWYYLGACQEKLGEDHTNAFESYRKIIYQNDRWMRYATYFNIKEP